MNQATDCSRADGAIVIVGSAGGITALIGLLRHLPKAFPFPIFVAQHLARNSPSLLPDLLKWHTGRSAVWATSRARPQAGEIYLVPAGCKLDIKRNRMSLTALPDNARSWLGSVDHLLHSLVDQYGSRLTAIMLSGALPVGVSGLRAVRARGGIVMAQNETSSSHFTMPRAAIDFAKVDIVFPPERIAEALHTIVGLPRVAA